VCPERAENALSERKTRINNPPPRVFHAKPTQTLLQTVKNAACSEVP
jgi:hypothetical protein